MGYLTRCRGHRPKRSRKHPDRFREEGIEGQDQGCASGAGASSSSTAGKGLRGGGGGGRHHYPRQVNTNNPNQPLGWGESGKAKKGKGSKKTAILDGKAGDSALKAGSSAPSSGRRNVKEHGDQTKLLQEHWDMLENEYFRPLLPEDVVFLQGLREQLRVWAHDGEEEDEDEDEEDGEEEEEGVEEYGRSHSISSKDSSTLPFCGGKKSTYQDMELEAGTDPPDSNTKKRCSPEPTWDVVKCSRDDDHGTILKFRRCYSPESQALPSKRLSWSAGSEGKKLRGEMEEQVDDNVKEDDKEEEEEEEDYDENLLSVEEEELMERLGELEQEVGSRLTSLARYTKLEMKGVEINEGLARTDRQTDRLYKHLYCRTKYARRLDDKVFVKSLPSQLSEEPRPPRFGVGQEVEVQGLDGCWTVGTVVAVREAALNRSYELLVRRQKWDSRFDEWIMESSCFVTKRGQHLAAEGNAPPVHMPNTKRPLNTSLQSDRSSSNGDKDNRVTRIRLTSSTNITPSALAFKPTSQTLLPGSFLAPPPAMDRRPLRSDSRFGGEWSGGPPPVSKLRAALRQLQSHLSPLTGS